MSDKFEDYIKRRPNKPLRFDYGFGMANIKTEGAPLHPDDAGIGKSNPLYQVQLKLYTDYLLRAQPDCTQSTIPDKQ